MAEKACHDDIVIAREHSGNVASFFTLPQLNVIWPQVDRMTPQLIEPGLKRHPCAHRWLGKNHGHRHPLQRLVVLVSRFQIGLHFCSPLQNMEDCLLVEIINVEKVCGSSFSCTNKSIFTG